MTELTANDGACYKHLRKIGTKLQDGLKKISDSSRAHTIVQGLAQCGVQIYFTPLKKITNYREFLACDGDRFTRYHRQMLKREVLVHPLQYQHMFVSAAHTEDDIDMTLKAAQESLQAVS